MIELIKDLWGFMRVRKKFWLAPIILIMLLRPQGMLGTRELSLKFLFKGKKEKEAASS